MYFPLRITIIKRKPYLQFVDYLLHHCIDKNEVLVILGYKKLSKYKILRLIIVENEKTSCLLTFALNLMLLVKYHIKIHIKEHFGHLNHFFYKSIRNYNFVYRRPVELVIVD